MVTKFYHQKLQKESSDLLSEMKADVYGGTKRETQFENIVLNISLYVERLLTISNVLLNVESSRFVFGHQTLKVKRH